MGPARGGRPREGLGGVYGRVASIRTDPAPRWERGGVSAVAPPRRLLRGWGDPPAPQKLGWGGERRKRPLSLGKVAVPQGLFARLCSLRCQGSFKYAPMSLPALVSLVSRRRGEALPPLRHLAPPRHSPAILASGEPLRTVACLVTSRARVCGVRRPAECPLRNAA